MQFDYNIPIEQIPFYLFVIIVDMFLSGLTWQFRAAPGARPLLLSLSAKALALSALVMGSISTGLQEKMIWFKLFHFAIILVPYLAFKLVIDMSGQRSIIPTWILWVMRGGIGCLWLAIFVDQWYELLWRQVWLEGTVVKAMAGPMLVIIRVTNYVLSLVAFVFGVRWIFITAGLRRQHALWITVSGLLSITGGILYIIPASSWLAPLPLGFLLNGLAVTWGYYRWQLCNVLPMAEKETIRNMKDGLVVIDEYGFIVEMNQAAEKVFDGLPVAIGSRFDKLKEIWPDLAEVSGVTSKTVEIVRVLPEGNRYYHMVVTPLQTGGQWLGMAIMLKDISIQKHLLEAQRTLSVINERDRLGREIHDGWAQRWQYFNLELQTILSICEKGQLVAAKEQLSRLSSVVRELNTDVRESIVGLKKANVTSDFLAELEDYLSWYESSTGIVSQVVAPIERLEFLLSSMKVAQLFRIIQESLTNIRKHAHANKVIVRIERVGNLVITVIEDDGCGFDAAALPRNKRSFGLQIMAERAHEEGGTLSVESKPGAGTKVVVEFHVDIMQHREE